MEEKTIVLIGGGFIGQHLLAALLASGMYRVRVLTRSGKWPAKWGPTPEKVEVFAGNVQNSKALAQVLCEGCIVVNLVYLWEAGEAANLAAIANLLDACKAVKVSRFIHLSTADVAGRVYMNFITESTPCNPANEYARTKLKIEAAILAATGVDAIMLRPTAVLGRVARTY
jgi:nucleoside-diphosphate-sugar epimerase